jgi:hypothetical protein
MPFRSISLTSGANAIPHFRLVVFVANNRRGTTRPRGTYPSPSSYWELRRGQENRARYSSIRSQFDLRNQAREAIIENAFCEQRIFALATHPQRNRLSYFIGPSRQIRSQFSAYWQSLIGSIFGLGSWAPFVFKEHSKQWQKQNHPAAQTPATNKSSPCLKPVRYLRPRGMFLLSPLRASLRQSNPATQIWILKFDNVRFSCTRNADALPATNMKIGSKRSGKLWHATTTISRAPS